MPLVSTRGDTVAVYDYYTYPMSESTLLRYSHEKLVAETHRHNIRLDPVDYPRSLRCSSGEGQIENFMKTVEIKWFGHCVGFWTRLGYINLLIS